jgi:hypothetical protein
MMERWLTVEHLDVERLLAEWRWLWLSCCLGLFDWDSLAAQNPVAGKSAQGDSVNTLILRYQSGEEIKRGDHVLFHGNPAEVELVAVDPNDPEQAWYMQEFEGGVLILDPTVSGRTFIPKGDLGEYEDLEFVSRA